MSRLTKEEDRPDVTWLRLPPTHLRVFAYAWSADWIIVSGRDLAAARRLRATGLLHQSRKRPDQFRLTNVGRYYPLVGLKALMRRRHGILDLTPAGRAALAAHRQENERG